MTTSDIHVLLVEDNPGDALLVSEALNDAPGPSYVVTHCASLGDAVKTAGRRFDVVLLDLSLPDSAGLDTLASFQRSWPGTPVIVLTGLDDDRVGVASLQRGAQDYIVKDEATSRRLGRAIRFAIQRAQATQQVQQWRERYTLWIQQSGDGLWDWDLGAGRITFSPGWKKSLGFEPDEIGDGPNEWFDRVLPRDAERLADTLQKAIDSDEPTFTIDYRIFNRSQRVRWMRARAMVVRDAAGHPVRVAGSQNDITHQIENPCPDCGHSNVLTAVICERCEGRLETSSPRVDTVDRPGRADLPDGTVLANRYTIEELIDVGSAGAVYLARDDDTGRRVAVKVLHAWLHDTPHSHERFIEEGRVQTRIHHPNVVQVLDVDADQGRDFIVMELASGPTMREFMVSSDCPHDPVELVQLFLPLIDGMSAVHAHGVVHRDVKPENILVVPADTGFALKLTDFGVAKATADGAARTHAGAVIGTLQYMAPEQFVDAGASDQRADIYALGCTLYELLTRRPPFDYESEFRMMTAHLTETASSPRTFNPLISHALGDAVLQALAKDPDERYPDCAALQRALRDAIGPT